MFGMAFAIDVVYLNKHYEIVKLVRSLKPWQASISLNAKHVLELSAGTIERHNMSKGTKLLIKEKVHEKSFN